MTFPQLYFVFIGNVNVCMLTHTILNKINKIPKNYHVSIVIVSMVACCFQHLAPSTAVHDCNLTELLLQHIDSYSCFVQKWKKIKELKLKQQNKMFFYTLLQEKHAFFNFGFMHSLSNPSIGTQHQHKGQQEDLWPERSQFRSRPSGSLKRE